MVGGINDFPLRQMAEGRETVLIIDEAQDLTNELLEQVQIAVQFGDRHERKLLQIVLMGQPELKRTD